MKHTGHLIVQELIFTSQSKKLINFIFAGMCALVTQQNTQLKTETQICLNRSCGVDQQNQ